MIKKFDEFIEEGALPREQSVKQLNKVKSMCKKTDIGNKVSIKSNNLISDKSALTNIESFEDFEKSNKNFNPNWNNTGQEPYKKKKK
jgi:hypothetical protein